MNYKESLELLTSQSIFHINLGLDRIKKVAEFLSNPQDSIHIVHVAGTNGKGSTCAMIATFLNLSFFINPHNKNRLMPKNQYLRIISQLNKIIQ